MTPPDLGLTTPLHTLELTYSPLLCVYYLRYILSKDCWSRHLQQNLHKIVQLYSSTTLPLCDPLTYNPPTTHIRLKPTTASHTTPPTNPDSTRATIAFYHYPLCCERPKGAVAPIVRPQGVNRRGSNESLTCTDEIRGELAILWIHQRQVRLIREGGSPLGEGAE